MFLSSSYVYYREVTLDEDMLNITAIGDDVAENSACIGGKGNENLQTPKEAKYFSASTNVSDKADTLKGTRKSKSLTSLNYDGDTDSINGDEIIKYEDIKLKCTICNLEYNAYLELPQRLDFKDGFNFKKKTKRFRKKKSKKPNNYDEEDDDYDEDYRKVNFEEYKDWAHKMEEFDPKAERKWTLEYNVKNELPQLSKIIVGRGHDNEFPELNNIHLFDDIRSYEKSSWRNSLLKSFKQKNSTIKKNYTLIPSNQTCLFCFTERQSIIANSISEGQVFIPILSLSETFTTDQESQETSCNGETPNGHLESPIIQVSFTDERNNKGKHEKDTSSKKKLTNVFRGKSITKIMRSRKDNTDVLDDDSEEFEIL